MKDNSCTIQTIANYVANKFKNKCGIIYCHSKSDAELCSKHLNKLKITSNFYHRECKDKHKFKAQDDWMNGEVSFIFESDCYLIFVPIQYSYLI